MSRKVLGLDIRNHCLAAVMVKSGLKENRIAAHAYIPLRRGGEDENGLAAAIETLAEKMDLLDCDAVVSAPSYLFSYRNLRVPFNNAKKIRMVLPFELEPSLPYQIDDLAIDFQTIEAAEPTAYTDIIAATIEKSQLKTYIEALSALKMEPEIVTISGLPTALCLAGRADQDENRLFIEVDVQHCSLFIIVAGQIKLIRSLALKTAVSSKAKLLCSQIRRTIAAFEEISQSDFQPFDIILTGHGLDGANLVEDVAGILEMPAKAANLSNRLEIPIESPAEGTWNHAQMDNALALTLMEIEALKGFNFHKGQFAVQKFLTKYKHHVVKTGILAAAVLALLFFNVLIESYGLQRKLNHIDRQMTDIFKSTFPEVKKIVDPFQQMKVKLQEAQKSSAFQTETGAHIRSIDILNSISRRIPKETVVDITRLVISPQNVLISGNTDTFNSVDDIKGRLEGIDFFQKVTISSANIDRSGKEVRFMLKADL